MQEYDGAMEKIAALENSLSDIQKTVLSSPEVGSHFKKDYHVKVICPSIIH